MTIVLTTPRLVLEPMAPQHASRLAQFFVRNEAHLRPWDPPRPRGITEVEFWIAEAQRAVDDQADGAVARWVLLLRDDPDRIVGRVNFTQIVRGPFQSCMLGYAADGRCQGRGLMFEALQAALDHAFRGLRLHRVQANHVPENQRSARLLQRLGFQVEGLARNYLFINGAWRDHVLTALTYPQFDTRIYSPGA
ncbi:MAG TPA: GNAT family N-acetyltransferase [Burkholderiaceae bacterium]|nr:GNAT family N-acetyltransferase [Burkholderiaceae bacterium]